MAASRLHHIIGFFFFNDTATTEIYTLSLHDALPILHITIIELNALHTKRQNLFQELDAVIHLLMEEILSFRSEERFSRNAEADLVCRLLLEKKKTVGDTYSNVICRALAARNKPGSRA